MAEHPAKRKGRTQGPGVRCTSGVDGQQAKLFRKKAPVTWLVAENLGARRGGGLSQGQLQCTAQDWTQRTEGGGAPNSPGGEESRERQLVFVLVCFIFKPKHPD